MKIESAPEEADRMKRKIGEGRTKTEKGNWKKKKEKMKEENDSHFMICVTSLIYYLKNPVSKIMIKEGSLSLVHLVTVK